MKLNEMSSTSKAVLGVASLGLFASTAFMLYKSGKLQLPASLQKFGTTTTASAAAAAPVLVEKPTTAPAAGDSYWSRLYNSMPSLRG